MTRSAWGLFVLILLVGVAASAAPAPAPAPEEKAETPEQALAAMKAQLGDGFRYRVVRVFAVASDAPADALARYCDQTITACYDAYMKQFFKAKPAGAFRVYLFKDDASYRANAQKLFGTLPDTPFGYFSPSHRALVMNIATGGGTLVHEMFHALARGDFPDIPAWANEGFASLFEQCGFAPDGSLVGYVNWRLPILQDAIKKGTLPPLRRIMTMTDAEFYADRQGKYAAARYFMLWMQEQGKLVELYKRFRDRFAEDRTGVKFAEEMLGRRLEEFEPGWRKWVAELKR